MSKNNPDERHGGPSDFVVVVSHGRSGSTVLQRVLNDIPGVVVRGENGGTLRHLERAWRSLSTAKERFGGLPSTRPDDPWFGMRTFDEAVLVDHIRSLVLDAVLAVPADARVVGYKEIRFTPTHFTSFDQLVDHLGFLDRLFPGVRFWVNVRDPEATARSGWWAANPDAPRILAQTAEWLRELPAAINGQLQGERAVGLQYEAWTNDPQVLQTALEFLDLSAREERISELLGVRLTHMQ